MDELTRVSQKILKRFPHRREDFLTIFEKTWRDWLLWPLTALLHAIGITPNALTAFGGILIAVSIGGTLTERIAPEMNFWILLAALLTDLVDGPLARNHNMVTVLGIWLDHIRDYAWILWVSLILLWSGLVPLETLGLLFGLTLLYFGPLMRGLLIEFLKSPKGKFMSDRHFARYTFARLQASIFGRAQFAMWGIAYVFYLWFLLGGGDLWLMAADTLISLTIVFSAIQVYRGFAHTFTPPLTAEH